MQDESKTEAEKMAEDAIALQAEVDERQTALMQDERFREFIQFQREAEKRIQSTWAAVEAAMINHDIKSIKGDWGSLTIAERIGWDVDLKALPPRFLKKVPDFKKLTETFRLEGEAPKGATPKYTKFLTKRIK